MNKFETKLTVIREHAEQVAKIASSALGVPIPDDKLRNIIVRAETKLPDSIVEDADKRAVAVTIQKAIKEASKEYKEEELSSNNTDKTGGSVMSDKKRLIPTRDPDFVDEVNAAGDKIAAGQGEIAGTEVRMMQIQRDPVGSIAAAFEKLGNLKSDLDKIAAAIETLENQVPKLPAKDMPNSDAEVQDESAKGEGADETLIPDPSAIGQDIMEGDPSGQKSKPTNPAMAGAGGVSANEKATVGDVIANANKASARVASVLKNLKKK
jgi:hypothetical protein